jgi:hypothetical protein
MSPQTNSAPSPRAPRARATSRWHQLDAGEADLRWRCRPARRPAAAPCLVGRRLEQARKQALAAADVEHARARRDQAVDQQVSEHRVPAQLAAREMQREPARGPIGALARATSARQDAAAVSVAVMATPWPCRRAGRVRGG